MAKKQSNEAVETLFAELFFDVISAVVKADSVEPQFRGIQQTVKGLTKDEVRRISAVAGRYFAEHAESSPNKMTKNQIATLKRKALEFALKAR